MVLFISCFTPDESIVTFCCYMSSETLSHSMDGSRQVDLTLTDVEYIQGGTMKPVPSCLIVDICTTLGPKDMKLGVLLQHYALNVAILISNSKVQRRHQTKPG